MVSICDDLRRLDKMLLHLSRGSACNPQTHVLLCSARRRVQALEKKARSLGALNVLHGHGVLPSGSSGGSFGGSAPVSCVDCTASISKPWHGRTYSFGSTAPFCNLDSYLHQFDVETAYVQ